MRRAELAAAARQLRSLHRRGRPLVLPNAWDAMSATLVERAGFAAVATSSSALVRSLGWEDGSFAPPDEVFAAVGRISSAVDVPVTADMEDGYGLAAGELVERLLDAGAVGCNLEDSDHHGAAGEPLVSAGAQAERIAAVKDAARVAGVDIVLNARIDEHLRAAGPEATRLEEALRRARRYVDAGADCVYPIMVADEAAVAAFVATVDAPVNVLASIGQPRLDRLAELGVGRISFGPRLADAAMEVVRSALDRLQRSAARGKPS